MYRDRHGKQRVYFRKPGAPLVALPGPLYSEAFWIAYHKAMAGETVNSPVGSGRVKAGSLSALIVEYYQSAEYKTLAESTRGAYQRGLDRFRQEHGDKPVALLETKHINKIIDQMADRPAAADNLRDRLSELMKFAIGPGYRDDNPVLFAKRVKYKTAGIRPWTEGDIIAYRERWPIGTPQRLAVEILLFTGLRKSDAVRLGRQYRQGSHFKIATKKSQGTVTLEIPIHPTLDKHLTYAPANSMVYLVTAHGRSRSEKAFTNWLREAAHKAGLPSDSSPHGLRKAACRRLAEAGCTPHQIMAITGHQQLAEVETYTKDVNQKRLAQGAMATIIDAFPAT